MGLADRFKDSLVNKDIFQKVEPVVENEEKITKKEMKFVTTPIQHKNNFDELETNIIDKIRKTPYWGEYSSIEQRKMISAYFSKKLADTGYTEDEKEEFVHNILILSNNQ